MTKKTIVMIIIFSLMSNIVGCSLPFIGNDISFFNSQNKDADSSNPIRGGILNLPSTVPDTFNPIASQNIFVRDYTNLFYDGLYKIDSMQRAFPQIVESHEVSADGTSWTFKLRKDVKWHDGIALSANDVDFTFKQILSMNATSIYKNNISGITSFSVIDNNTFNVSLANADAFLPWKLTFPILPQHYYALESNGMEKDKQLPPIGTGPYMFSEMNEKKSIKYKLNEKWWGGSQKKKPPYIQGIEVKLYENMNKIQEAFILGDVDTISLEPGMWRSYSGRRDLALQKYPSNQFEFIAFNCAETASTADKDVRRAVGACIDRAELVKDTVSAEAIPFDLPIYPEAWLNKDVVLPSSAGVEAAKEILQTAGWKIEDGKQYKDNNGYKVFLKINLLYNKDNTRRLEMAQKINEILAKAGIRVELVGYSNDAYFEALKLKTFEMAIAGTTVVKYPDINNSYLGTNQDLNIAGFSTTKSNELIYNYMAENDIEKKTLRLKDIRTYLNEEVPYIGLYFLYSTSFYNKKLRGTIEPHYWDKLNDFVGWYIAQ